MPVEQQCSLSHVSYCQLSASSITSSFGSNRRETITRTEGLPCNETT